MEPGIKIENFTLSSDGLTVLGNIMVMDDSCSIWIGTSSCHEFGSLEMAMPTRFDPIPLSKSIFKENLEATDSSDMAKRLAKKFKIQCYISNNLTSGEETILFDVEKKIIELLASHFPT